MPACGCFFRDFLNSLRLYRTYYGGLADQLCVSELASGDGLSCWNGTDIVKRFVLLGCLKDAPPHGAAEHIGQLG